MGKQKQKLFVNATLAMIPRSFPLPLKPDIWERTATSGCISPRCNLKMFLVVLINSPPFSHTITEDWGHVKEMENNPQQARICLATEVQ